MQLRLRFGISPIACAAVIGEVNAAGVAVRRNFRGGAGFDSAARRRRMSNKVVCVTGASGYIASWLVKLLLRKGYTVRGSVRDPDDPKKTEHLRQLEGANERLHLFKGNLLDEGSFDTLIDGCECVFHTASPFFHAVTDPQVDLIEPAVKGTLNVLRSCAKTASIRRVIITSSIAAVAYNEKPRTPDVTVDETWFSNAEICEKNKSWYVLSKILAEDAAWKFSKEHDIDMVTINPAMVIGPLLQPTLNTSAAAILNLINGFEHPLMACCGFGGGQLNYDNRVPCGETRVVDGRAVTASGCNDTAKYVNWDGVHYTDAANLHVSLQILSGRFSYAL